MTNVQYMGLGHAVPMLTKASGLRRCQCVSGTSSRLGDNNWALKDSLSACLCCFSPPGNNVREEGTQVYLMRRRDPL